MCPKALPYTFIKKDSDMLRNVCLGFYQLGLFCNLLYIQLLPQQLKSLEGCQGHTVSFLPVNLFMAH